MVYSSDAVFQGLLCYSSPFLHHSLHNVSFRYSSFDNSSVVNVQIYAGLINVTEKVKRWRLYKKIRKQCSVSTDGLPLWAKGTCTSRTFLPLLTPSSSLISSFLLPVFTPCPVTEPGVWSDCDIDCVGDRLTGVISEVEENRSATLYSTPSSPSPSHW